MSKLEKIAAKAVIQGPTHQKNMTEYFAVLVRAARKEFTEDNKPTLDGFLRECFEESLEE
jgi:hypothetical protein